MSLYAVSADHVPASSGFDDDGLFWLYCSCGWNVAINRYEVPYRTDAVARAGERFREHKTVTIYSVANIGRSDGSHSEDA